MDVYLARQPIFDTRRQVQAYELLARSGTENAFFGDPSVASQQTVDTTLLTFGLDSLLGSRDGYFQCVSPGIPDEPAVGPPPAGQDGHRGAFETVEPDAEVVAACAAARCGRVSESRWTISYSATSMRRCFRSPTS